MGVPNPSSPPNSPELLLSRLVPRSRDDDVEEAWEPFLFDFGSGQEKGKVQLQVVFSVVLSSSLLEIRSLFIRSASFLL